MWQTYFYSSLFMTGRSVPSAAFFSCYAAQPWSISVQFVLVWYSVVSSTCCHLADFTTVCWACVSVAMATPSLWCCRSLGQRLIMSKWCCVQVLSWSSSWNNKAGGAGELLYQVLIQWWSDPCFCPFLSSLLPLCWTWSVWRASAGKW